MNKATICREKISYSFWENKLPPRRRYWIFDKSPESKTTKIVKIEVSLRGTEINCNGNIPELTKSISNEISIQNGENDLNSLKR